MPCYSPAWIPHPRAPKGSGIRLLVGCGRCIGCLLSKGREWTARCVHESYRHRSTFFLTLTYSDENLFQYGSHPSLNPPDMTFFLKRLRQALWRRDKRRVDLRYLYCGEYGERTERPHYHAILFGLELNDLVLYSTTGGNYLYESKFVSDAWGLGQVLCSVASPETMAYTAGYTIKKLYGPDASLFYASRGTYPPFIRMSRRPAIGAGYIEANAHFIASNDYVFAGSKFKVPRFYDKVLYRRFHGKGIIRHPKDVGVYGPSRLYIHRGEPLYAQEDPAFRAAARVAAAVSDPDSRPDRLEVRHQVALEKRAFFHRPVF